ncbi:MAG: GAF domain-containing protein, partial [Verrucomicrobiota bacterium]
MYLREALQLVLREAVGLMRANSGSVCLVNPTTGFLELEAAHGLPPDAPALKLRVGEGITGWVARTGRPARVGDVSKDKRYFGLRPGIRSELAVPLRVGDAVRGVINVDSDRADAFTDKDQSLLQDLASLAAPAIANTWLYEQSRQKARLLESLVRVGQIINSTLSLDDALEVITREARTLLGAKMISLMMLDETREWLDLRAHVGAGAAYVGKGRLGVSESFVGIVLRRKKPMQLEDVQGSGRYQNASLARREGLVSLLSVPLLYGTRAIGTLNLYTGEPHTFSDEEVRVLTTYAELSALALEKARLYERIVSVEEELRQSERLSALGLLAAEIAHEIRNPLTVMKMLHHSLALDFPADDPRRTDVRIMGEKMDHLNRIVDQVLDFARSSDPQRIPVTVLSRCLQFNLKQIPQPQIRAQLAKVLGLENIEFEDDALGLLARAARGSMRDSLSLLDQAIAHGGGRVETASVRAMLGSVEREYLYEILAALRDADGPALIAVADRMTERSLSFENALQDLGSLLHRVALLQAIPAALAEDDPDYRHLSEMAASFAAEEIQLFYQIALQGRQEIGYAPDEYAGFTMTLMRMLAFTPAAAGAGAAPQRAVRPATPVAASVANATAAAYEVPARPTAAPATTATTKKIPLEGDWTAFVGGLPLAGMERMLA